MSALLYGNSQILCKNSIYVFIIFHLSSTHFGCSLDDNDLKTGGRTDQLNHNGTIFCIPCSLKQFPNDYNILVGPNS